MNEHEQNNPDTEDYIDLSDAEQYDPAAEAGGTKGEEAAQPGAQDELSRLQVERDELESKFLRVSADYQNFARRAQQNVEAAGQQKLMDIARDLVSVLDHFDRALDVETTEDGAGVLQGVTMVHTELLAALNRFGIQRLDVEPGSEFDPNQHEALMRQPSDDIASNHVTMQMQPGYMLGDKVIRPAQVGVAE